MRKIFILFVFCLSVSAGFFGSTRLMALDTPDNIANCPGEIVVNVVHTVTNDVDSRVGGGVWAFNNYERRIRVWQAFPSVNVYCAKVEYKGFFTTIAGESPQGTDPNIPDFINGTFQGGYRTNYFYGALNPTPPKPRHGNLGNINYRCKSNDPGDHSSCTNLWVWQTNYFNSIRYVDPVPGHEYIWWGWSYNGDENGIWNNICAGRPPICPGNSGDITD